MKRLALVAALLLVSAAALVRPPAARAESGLSVVSSAARNDFPTGVTFTLEATSTMDITDVSLQLNTPLQRYGAYPRNVHPDFQPGTHVTARWTWRRYGSTLPPGAEITYRWQMTDASGAVLETPVATVMVEDTRFQWRQLSAGPVTVRWYRGDDAFGRSMLEAATAAVDQLAREQGVDLQNPVTVHIYGSQNELYSALPGTPPWIGGISIGEYDSLLVPVPPDDPAEGRKALVHELTHELIYQITFNPSLGSRVPAWLNEGLAVVSEGPTSRASRRALNEAVDHDRLPTLRVLGNSFSALPGAEAQTAYAASESVVRYLLDEYGADQMRSLLAQFRDGRTADDALRRVYGLGQDAVEDGWRTSLGLRPLDRGAGGGLTSRARSPAPHGAANRQILVAGGAAMVTVLLLGLAGTAAMLRRRRSRITVIDRG